MKLHIHRCFLVLPLLLTFEGFGQKYMDMDSLKSELGSAGEDSTKVQLYISLGQQYEGNQPDSAIFLYEQALNLSKRLNYTRGIISYYTNITFVYNMLGKLDTSLFLNLQSVDIAREFGDQERLGTCLNNVATSYLSQEKYDSAIVYYLRSVEIFEGLGLTKKQSVIYSNIVAVYNDIQDYQKALLYTEKAIHFARQSDDTWQILLALNNGSLPLTNTGRYQDAIDLLNEGITICRDLDDEYTLNSMLSNLGDIYLKQNRIDEVFKIFEEGYTIAKKLEDSKGLCTHARGLAYYFLNKRNFNRAMFFANEALENAKKYNYQKQQQISYLLISDIYLAEGNLTAYNTFRYKNDSIQDVIANDKLQKNLQRLEEQYKAKLRDQQIEELKNEKTVQQLQYRTNQLILFSIVGFLLTFSILTLLLLRSARQKRQLLEKEKVIRKARIAELEKEKQLLASEAILKGQEEERHRLAKDLHDGLGGMLSGIKFSFSTMKENLIMTPENQRAFERSMDMLDSSIREMRRVAHNLMPESLIKFGLSASINDICKDITASGALKVNFQPIDLDKLLVDQPVLIIIYRIVQELLNNVMKHAGARNVLVQLIYRDGKLSLTVEDDGKGFDTTSINLSEGIGLSNIKSRIDYLGGTWDIQSDIGKGTTVTIDLIL